MTSSKRKGIKGLFLVAITSVVLFSVTGCGPKEGEEYYLKFKKLSDTQEYFAYKADSTILISGHRGTKEAGFPENSIEGFQHALTRMPLFFEVDPRLTKDSVIVLMHDETIDRTTNASGKLSDYNYDELLSIRLKDHEGNITATMIPKLEEVFDWSKGKTVINLDRKDVPHQMIVDLIKKNKAEKYVMLTVHTGAQARFYHDRLPGVMLSVFARNDAEYEDVAISGVPWENMIAYVGQSIDESNRHIVEKLHANGVRCMVSFAPTHDRQRTTEQRMAAYIREFENSVYKPDIIESDYPVEVWGVFGAQ
ncbi:MAG: glycerophosphodiester phosphodiesterase family protein [Fermentimonas sp.]|jgi:glycerophosphoryl diester phosphodiesterase|nr:glycerophosphodiester phosphodiesterase family protein [Fermentimonas sp.]NLC87057.1 glycerophosphodiester phosphodiesterase family protein [Bacteroidales bacterium]MDD2930426.1 glycerophosphodiester phosphodiesterase family protein [Fermentimonas sp.]MDD3188594.1 glycerophosphodiester phosphodiesterase family protein [Fermentimonas sp.]MDD3511269.1 glycerophosphodiester phosphodiesterase family protein [Fermentimonas sp.]